MSDRQPKSAPPIVVLIGGASGVGKTQVSYRLARQLGCALVEVDDLVIGIQAVTDPSTHPALHQWLTPDQPTLSADEVVARQVEFAAAMAPAVTAVVRNHLDTGTPVVIEGDYVTWEHVDGGAVRGVLIAEDDVEHLVRNLRSREPASGEQRARAVASAAYGRWLAVQARAAGVPIVPARPWPTVLERLVAALGPSAQAARGS